ncbi:hypothetical protein MARI151_10699 [Maribacter litoralis]|uniref:Uncharacterized protein n=1 Tax=Maribacter litoralis TaxID=2059726 RepID=A0A653NI99_9FLAO|nr:hypothetical protein MARI151_10699 [Maribacter litoralis]
MFLRLPTINVKIVVLSISYIFYYLAILASCSRKRQNMV